MRFITAEQYAELPTWLKSQYKEADGDKKGQFEMAKPPEGYQPKEKVDEFRENNIQLLRRIEALEGTGKPSEETEALKAKLAEFEQEKLKDAGKWDEWRQNWEAQTRDKLAAKDKETEKLKSDLKVFRLNNRIREAAVKNGIAADNANDVVGLLADRTIKLAKDGESLEIYDLDGTPFQGDVNQFFSEYYKGKRPLYYDGANPAGGGATQSDAQPQAQRSAKTIKFGDNQALSQNLEAVANGDIQVTG